MQIMLNQNTGSSAEFKYVYGTKPANIFVSGVFDGATLSLQAQTPEGDWVNVKDGEIFEPVMLTMEAFPFKGRMTISGETINTSITCSVIGQIII